MWIYKSKNRINIYSLSTEIWEIHGDTTTLSGNPGGNFVALATFINTLIGEIFPNDAYKPNNVLYGRVSMFINEPSVKYTNPWSAVSNQFLSF